MDFKSDGFEVEPKSVFLESFDLFIAKSYTTLGAVAVVKLDDNKGTGVYFPTIDGGKEVGIEMGKEVGKEVGIEVGIEVGKEGERLKK
jgi:hypothetical protein